MDISDPAGNSAHKGTTGAMLLVSLFINEASRWFRRTIEIDSGLLLRKRNSALIVDKRCSTRRYTGLTSSSFRRLLSTSGYCCLRWSRHKLASLRASSHRNRHVLFRLARHSEGLIQITFENGFILV